MEIKDDNTYFIIYPKGDRKKLSYVGLNPSMLYEITDYARASRKEFSDRSEAKTYGQLLALENDLTWETSDGEDDYLD